MIDSHAHLTAETLFPQVETIVKNAFSAGVHAIVNICTELECIAKGKNIAATYPSKIFNAAAVHPHDAGKEWHHYYSVIEQEANKGTFVAIGETGLDYHYQFASKERQIEALKKHLQLAMNCKLPVIIHCREAFDDLLRAFDTDYRRFDGSYYPGVLHCFTGTMDEAKEVLKRGFYISLSGIVTFKKSLELQKVAKIIPLDRLLIETDSPFLAPQSRRGKTNEPAYLPETAQMVANLREISLTELSEATSQNTATLFHLT